MINKTARIVVGGSGSIRIMIRPNHVDNRAVFRQCSLSYFLPIGSEAIMGAAAEPLKSRLRPAYHVWNQISGFKIILRRLNVLGNGRITCIVSRYGSDTASCEGGGQASRTLFLQTDVRTCAVFYGSPKCNTALF